MAARLYSDDARRKPTRRFGARQMPGLITLPVGAAAVSAGHGFLLQFPSATTQILASAVLTLLIIFGVVCLRQSGAGRRWAGLFNARPDRDNRRSRRQESTKRDQPAAPAQKPPPGRDNSNGPSPH